MRKHYSLRYFTGQAMTGLWRNGVMSVASVAVLMSCLVVLGCFALLLVNINVNLDNVAQLNQIVVYCDYDLDEAAVEKIGNQIEELDYTMRNCTAVSQKKIIPFPILLRLCIRARMKQRCSIWRPNCALWRACVKSTVCIRWPRRWTA